MTTDLQSWVSLYVCLILSIILIAVRLFLRRWRQQAFTRGDYWCILAAIFVLGRLIGNHFLLLYGSTRTLKPQQRIRLKHASESELAQKIIGSKLVLCTRTLLVCILWSAKMAVLDLLAYLVMRLPFERKVLYTFWAILLTTFVASIVTTFSSCSPISLHWQIEPNPGNCVIGATWIYTYESSNIITDALLMGLSFSLVLSVRIPVMQKLRILCLFGVGILLVAISINRIVAGQGSHTQSGHTLWASLEVLFAIIVAVTPTIYALARNKKGESSYAHGQSQVSCRIPDLKMPPVATAEGRSGEETHSVAIWTELEDGRHHEDDSSVSRILIREDFEVARSQTNK
ncbi:hypothetical protein DE146DRAFT_115018 [Phaeosphaeria sp. MPI-PUGE-AT-0046c]|nr:hypothetical protein DE146DRAFT_115018 [Phaeosphaeria sp. MPI-PUGE-AT-0046c]